MGFQYSAQGISGDLTPSMQRASRVRRLTGRCRRKSPEGAAERPVEGDRRESSMTDSPNPPRPTARMACLRRAENGGKPQWW